MTIKNVLGSLLFLGCSIPGISSVAYAQGNPVVSETSTPDTNIAKSDVLMDVRDYSNARIQPVEEAEISAPMNGRLEEFSFHDGDTFHKGDTLARYHCALQAAQLEKAKAEYVKASGILSMHNNAQASGLYARSDIISARADVGLARADEDSARANLDDCVVVAPYDGIVSAVEVHPSQFTQTGSPMLHIVGTDGYEVSIILHSKDMAHVAVGKPFSIHIKETNRDYSGKYTRISGSINPVSQTVRVYGVLDGVDKDLRAGMTGSVVAH